MDTLPTPLQQAAQDYGWIIPNWPAPVNVRAISTTRLGGVSAAPFDSLNLGNHVQDNPQHVVRNRQIVTEVLQWRSEPFWLNQVHSTVVQTALPQSPAASVPCADASFSSEKGQVCVVMTADCLPVLFCDQAGTTVAAAHAGWRGLCDGILEETLMALSVPAQSVLVWLGPSIGATAFEVGGEVRDQFIAKDPSAESAFVPVPHSNKWLGDLYAIAKQRLQRNGVNLQHIYGGEYCTYTDKTRFFSYRRDGQTGRMGSFIWLEQ